MALVYTLSSTGLQIRPCGGGFTWSSPGLRIRPYGGGDDEVKTLCFLVRSGSSFPGGLDPDPLIVETPTLNNFFIIQNLSIFRFLKSNFFFSYLNKGPRLVDHLNLQ